MAESDPGKLDIASQWSDFGSLSNSDLYDLLKLRVDVFIVEQECAYAEIDGRDRDALHLTLKHDDRLIAGLRLLPPNGSGSVRLGRIVVHPDYREKGLGRMLMTVALEQCKGKYPDRSVILSSQVQMQGFYSLFGFEAVSDRYMEDGIEHVDMVLKSLNGNGIQQSTMENSNGH